MTGILEGRDLTVRSPGRTVLDGVDVDVGEWEIVGVFGPASGGKTTIVDALTGFVVPQGGTVRYRGAEVTFLAPHRLARMGISRTWERIGAFPSLTVLQNLLTAQHAHAGYGVLSGIVGGPSSFAEEGELRRNAEEILSFLGMLPLADEMTGRLPEPARRMCDLAMALATDPDVVLLDEPTAGMSWEERARFGHLLRDVRDSLNMTFLVAAREPAGLLDVCDFAYVVQAGRVLASGEPPEIRAGPELARAYGGGRGTA